MPTSGVLSPSALAGGGPLPARFPSRPNRCSMVVCGCGWGWGGYLPAQHNGSKVGAGLQSCLLNTIALKRSTDALAWIGRRAGPEHPL